jgi:hypothetical protein
VYGFLESASRIRTGTGQGKQGIAIVARPALYVRLKVAKPRYPRRGGTGVEHYFWACNIARATGGHLETMVNGRAVDIAVRYEQTKHDAFLRAVLDEAHRFTDDIAIPKEGDLFAIELEHSTDGIENARKNWEIAKIPLTILASAGNLLQTHAAIKQDLEPSCWPHTVLTSALRLVDLARKGM